MIVAVDKFSKWIEAKPLAAIDADQATDFVCGIIFRFEVPNSIIMDNGTQFTAAKFLIFCDDNNIRVDWAAVAHPWTNG